MVGYQDSVGEALIGQGAGVLAAAKPAFNAAPVVAVTVCCHHRVGHKILQSAGLSKQTWLKFSKHVYAVVHECTCPNLSSQMHDIQAIHIEHCKALP
jgi:hypothetical protein